jgi:hypothetical protein
MNFLERNNLTVGKILKMAGLTLLGVVVLVFVLSLVGSSYNSIFKKSVSRNSALQVAPSYSYGLSAGLGGNEMAYDTVKVGGMPTTDLSIRNTGVSGAQAEDFEVTEYSASIETRKLIETCTAVSGLKKLEYVIFENSSEYDKGCNYTFKVQNTHKVEILDVIKKLDPKEITENTYTIKKQVDDYTSQIDILKKKLASIDDTLKKATSAYDEVTVLATKVQNVESLAKIIDSKINLIERLTVERMDKLEYTYFHVNIFENKLVDGKNLKDSWKSTVQAFVRNLNKVAQDVTVNLVGWVFLVLQYAIYLSIILVVVKYGWKLIKYIWKK